MALSEAQRQSLDPVDRETVRVRSGAAAAMLMARGRPAPHPAPVTRERVRVDSPGTAARESSAPVALRVEAVVGAADTAAAALATGKALEEAARLQGAEAPVAATVRQEPCSALPQTRGE